MVSDSRILIVDDAHAGLGAAIAARLERLMEYQMLGALLGADVLGPVTIHKAQSAGKSETMQGLIEREWPLFASTPADRDRRTLLLDWPLTDPGEEAARREREARAQERRARFRHPEGPCSYRATGSKRSRHRRRGK